MPKEVWGSKHRCDSCGTKFYDMQRYPVECPNCGYQLEVFFKEDVIPDARDQEGIDLEIDSSDVTMKDDNDVKEDGIEDDSEDILDNDKDTVSLDEIKNITTENTD
ncbi:MAG: FYDLN acid domain-containing protein [Rhodobacteraceae bacterium]|nr:FYDLN acid domain-containing protein [Paracoccaceae bacterium]MCY4250407.1 FYDLN acid domain-containing protein [Paracoccaceae bacterium]MCY4308527.1 FYDLN acid domain-containing protein [Paracoccaceae bacterium]